MAPREVPSLTMKPNETSSSNNNTLKTRLMAEDKFVGDLLDLLNVPKHKLDQDDSEDEVDGGLKRLKMSNDRAKSVDDLHNRFQSKMAELRGNRKEGGGKR